jgi:putative hydroxymethylpyrimidine transport system permease protein
MMTFGRGCIVFLGLLLLWQGIVTFFSLPNYILPTPWEVWLSGYTHSGVLWHEAQFTITESLLGLLLAGVLGCFAALLMVFFPNFSLWLLPILIISQAVPTFAIAPLLVIWFGYGMISKIATTVIMLFFPIASAFHDGLKQTNSNWLDLAKMLSGKKWRIFIFIRIPAALPHLASGIRVATAMAPLGAIVGEWVGASHGLGFLMLNANARMQIDFMFAALFVLVIFSMLLYFSIDKLLSFFITWHT